MVSPKRILLTLAKGALMMIVMVVPFCDSSNAGVSMVKPAKVQNRQLVFNLLVAPYMRITMAVFSMIEKRILI